MKKSKNQTIKDRALKSFGDLGVKKVKVGKKIIDTEKKELLDLNEIDEVLKIEAGVYLNGIKLTGQIWNGAISIKTTLPKSYRTYKIKLTLDEHPYIQRMDDINRAHENSLFRDEAQARKNIDTKISEIDKQLQQLRKDCEVIEFTGIVESLKYGSGVTTLEMRFPDDIVEPFNRQKGRLDLYKVTLIPVL